MDRYANLGGNSGVIAYELLSDGIKVRFEDGAEYIYTVLSAGRLQIDKMKSLARTGRGLNSFINRDAKYGYASRAR